MIAQVSQLGVFWNQKRAFAREILGDDTLLREATPDLSHDRTRLELMLHKGKLGIRGPKKSSNDWDFDFSDEISFDFINPTLANAIREFSKSQLSALTQYFESAQLRFRLGASNQLGLWIDASREALESFAQSPECLEFQKNMILELGQRGDLVKASPQVWLPSFSKDNEEIPLLSLISCFSQPGPEANRALIACGMELLEDRVSEITNWTELGAGYGNLTAAYTTLLGSPRWILEREKRETALWTENKKYFSKAELFTKGVESLKDVEQFDLVIADPPRSGFSEIFKKDLLQARYVLLHSCDLKGLLSDSEALKNHYNLRKWSLIDLFPATPYAEALSLWERKV